MRCVEKFKMAEFRIDRCTIKMDKHALHYGYLMPLVSSNVVICLGGDR